MNLFVIHTPDLHATKQFYQQIGLKLTPEKHREGLDHFSSFFANGTVFKIYPGEKSRGGIGFETTQFEQVSQHATEASLSPTFVTRHGRRCLILRDPDGRRVEIFETFCSDSSTG